MAFTQALLTERKVITHLLQQYKHNTCLWNTKDPLYGNSDAKKEALLAMLDTYKLLIEDATLQSLKKKIENMRSAYRRERKKVQNNGLHKPCLWYYKLMTFLNVGEEDTSITEYQQQTESEDEVVEESALGETSSSQFCDIMNPELKVESFHPEGSTYTIKTNQLTEPDAFGRALGLQLCELTAMQKTIAEKLISDVIYYARLDKLTTKTSLINLSEDFL